MKRRDRLTLLQLDGLRASLPSLSLRRTAAPPHRQAVVPLTKTLANSAIIRDFAQVRGTVSVRGACADSEPLSHTADSNGTRSTRGLGRARVWPATRCRPRRWSHGGAMEPPSTHTTNWWLPAVAGTQWRMRAANAERAGQRATLGLLMEGVTVRSVLPGSPSAQGCDGHAIEPGDVVTHIDDQPVSPADVLARLRGDERPGSDVSIRVTKANTSQTMVFRLRRADVHSVLPGPHSEAVPSTDTGPASQPHAEGLGRSGTCQCQPQCRTCGLPMERALTADISAKLDLILHLLGASHAAAAKDLGGGALHRAYSAAAPSQQQDPGGSQPTRTPNAQTPRSPGLKRSSTMPVQSSAHPISEAQVKPALVPCAQSLARRHTPQAR